MHLDWLDRAAIQLVLPDRLLSHWRGIDSPDYGRACDNSSGWLNQLSVSGGIGFVLGGDPGMALVVPGDGDSVSIVRWLFGENEQELIAFALAGDGRSQTEPAIVFENAEANWTLFDAAAHPFRDIGEGRRLKLPLGLVRVRTAYRASERNAAIVHRFEKPA